MSILDWFRGAGGTASRAEQARIDETLERIVELTNPRLRFARRYRSRLAPAVQIAMEYARSLIAGARPAREASPAAWQADGYLRAFFTTAEDLARAFSRSPELRAWFEKNPVAEAHVVLSMQLVERRVLGVALERGVLRRDVPQNTVSFSDHRARLIGRSEAELRDEVERRLVDQLGLAGLALAAHDQSLREVLQQEHALLRARLRLLEKQGAGLTALAGNPATETGEVGKLQSELAVNEANLRSIAAGPQALDFQLEHLCKVLAEPQAHLFVSVRRLRLNRMNVVLSDDDPQPGETLDLQVARIPIPDGAPEFRTFLVVRFPRSALLARGALLSEAARTLH